MEENIDFKWCEEHGMEKPGMYVASESSYCLLDNGWYTVVYTERTTGEKRLFVNNPKRKFSIDAEMPKYDYENDKRNYFTTEHLRMMCEIVQLDYPF